MKFFEKDKDSLVEVWISFITWYKILTGGVTDKAISVAIKYAQCVAFTLDSSRLLIKQNDGLWLTGEPVCALLLVVQLCCSMALWQ